MDIREIAADMVAMTKAGDFHIGEKYGPTTSSRSRRWMGRWRA